MFRRISKGYLFSIVIILLLISLNPTYLDFKEFTGITGKESKNLHKKYNFLVVSVYQDDIDHKKYLGIMKNFIDITPNSKAFPTTIAADSVTSIIDSSAIVSKDSVSAVPDTNRIR